MEKCWDISHKWNGRESTSLCYESSSPVTADFFISLTKKGKVGKFSAEYFNIKLLFKCLNGALNAIGLAVKVMLKNSLNMEHLKNEVINGRCHL